MTQIKDRLNQIAQQKGLVFNLDFSEPKFKNPDFKELDLEGVKIKHHSNKPLAVEQYLFDDCIQRHFNEWKSATEAFNNYRNTLVEKYGGEDNVDDNVTEAELLELVSKKVKLDSVYKVITTERITIIMASRFDFDWDYIDTLNLTEELFKVLGDYASLIANGNYGQEGKSEDETIDGGGEEKK